MKKLGMAKVRLGSKGRRKDGGKPRKREREGRWREGGKVRKKGERQREGGKGEGENMGNIIGKKNIKKGVKEAIRCSSEVPDWVE